MGPFDLLAFQQRDPYEGQGIASFLSQAPMEMGPAPEDFAIQSMASGAMTPAPAAPQSLRRSAAPASLGGALQGAIGALQAPAASAGASASGVLDALEQHTPQPSRSGMPEQMREAVGYALLGAKSKSEIGQIMMRAAQLDAQYGAGDAVNWQLTDGCGWLSRVAFNPRTLQTRPS